MSARRSRSDVLSVAVRRAGARPGQDRPGDGRERLGARRRTEFVVVLAAGLATLVALGATPVHPRAARAGLDLTGHLLVATPEMPDPRFAHTVLYLIHHDAGGAQGLVLNRPLGEVPLAALLRQMRMDPTGVTGTARLHWGGPVEPRRVLVLHTAEYAAAGTRVIKGQIALTQEPAVLAALAHGTGPRRAFLALGYAGWAPGQLESEIKAGGWIKAQADESLVFDTDNERKWERAMEHRQVDL